MAALSLIENSLIQGFAYGIGVLGVMLAFRILRYPDLTPDGSFLLGSAAYAASVGSGIHWSVAMAMAFATGAAAGSVTSLLNSRLRVNRLLTGILTTMMAYSIGFRVLDGRPNVGLRSTRDVFDLASALDSAETFSRNHLHPGELLVTLGLAAVVALLVSSLLRSEWGLMLRATGNNRELVSELDRNPDRYQTLGLALANGIVGLGAAAISARQGFTDVNMGMGVVITLIAALVIGERIVSLARFDPTRSRRARVASAFLGGSAYFFLYLLILRASILGWIPIEISPTDLKFYSAMIVVAAVAVQARSSRREEVLPL